VAAIMRIMKSRKRKPAAGTASSKAIHQYSKWIAAQASVQKRRKRRGRDRNLHDADVVGLAIARKGLRPAPRGCFQGR
jgi:hypothetical protein